MREKIFNSIHLFFPPPAKRASQDVAEAAGTGHTSQAGSKTGQAGSTRRPTIQDGLEIGQAGFAAYAPPQIG
jgi:hypothetical protein